MKKIISILVLTAVLVSCGTSNSVVNDGLFQKRKYTSGWFVKKKKGIEKKSVEEESLALQEVNKVEKTEIEKQTTSANVKQDESRTNIVKDSKETTPKVTATKKRNNLFSSKTNQKAAKVERKLAADQSKEKTNIALNSIAPSQENKKVQSKKKQNSNDHSSEVALILLVILCFLIPPLAVWLASRDTTQLVISIILTLLFFLPGIIHALLVVFGVI
tara:strand:+ start:15912 stop:16562 length:651 start_codon:yes stop_codon:yes gene_type:complete